MSKRYGERGFGRYGDSDEDRGEDRDYEERDAGRAYGDAGERRGPGPEYGSTRRGGYSAARGDYGREREQDSREYGSRDYLARDYGTRYGSRDYGSRDYGSGEYQPRYGREGLSGGYAGSAPRRYEGDDYGREPAPRAYGRDAVRDYDRGERVRPRGVPEEEGVRDYDTDYGRTTSRFYGRSGYEYGREDYDRDDARDARGEYARRGDDRGERDEHGRGWLDRAADEVRSWFGRDDDEREGRGRADAMRASGGRGEGRFRGRGPRNYRRSDERVREEVCDRLTDNEWLDAADVEVSIAAGEVVLTGTVDSRYAKRLAENIAESVAGVTNVQNNLRVHNYQTAGLETAAAGTATTAGAPDVTGLADTPAAPESDPGDSHTPTTRHSSSRAAGGS